MKVYRNVYIKSGIPKFTGRELIYYYGKVKTNADKNNSISLEFDRNEDIYLGCDCDSGKYAGIIKKSKQTEKNQKRDNLNYGRKCKKC